MQSGFRQSACGGVAAVGPGHGSRSSGLVVAQLVLGRGLTRFLDAEVGWHLARTEM
jgi:hypothetical protein